VVLFAALTPIEPSIAVNDKVLHSASFFLLVLLARLGWGRQARIAVPFVLILVGAAIELLQAMPFIARDAELSDWLADIAGIGLALTDVWTLGIKNRIAIPVNETRR